MHISTFCRHGRSSLVIPPELRKQEDAHQIQDALRFVGEMHEQTITGRGQPKNPQGLIPYGETVEPGEPCKCFLSGIPIPTYYEAAEESDGILYAPRLSTLRSDSETSGAAWPHA